MANIHREGVTLLSESEGASGDQRHVNIIFVHGLRGHPRGTWSHIQSTSTTGHIKDTNTRTDKHTNIKTFFGLKKSKKETDDKRQTSASPPSDIFWPGEYLVPDLPQARIWTYGYNADVIGGLFQANNQNSVSQHGRDFAVRLERDIDNEDPMVFVAHSLGGIITKDALHKSETICKRTRLIVFLGTPHRGSTYAGWGEIASNLASLALQDSNKRLVQTLEVNGEVLDNIHEEFKTILSKCAIKVHSFQESKGISGMKGLNGKVVDNFSSKLDLASEQETVETIDANHMDMARCSSRDDVCYRQICGVLRQFIRTGLSHRETNSGQTPFIDRTMQQPTSTKRGREPNPVDTTGLCLLSLDGGGVRGLSALYILKSIMDRLNHGRLAADLPRVKPCEVFDLIGGTSTGGLIAIMLGRLEMDVDECIAAYSGLAAAVFGEKLSQVPVNIKGKIKPQFDSAKLESAIRKAVVQSGVSETDLLNDGTERGCRTFVCTVDRDTKDIVRLRSYSLPDEPNVSATICQAALATSAATAFFNPVSIGDRTFADGGLGANNPVDEVEGEASNVWCSETGDLKPLVKCFISIGTGNPGKTAFEDGMFKFVGQTVVDIATETENTEKKFIARWAKHFDESRYFRFSVDQGLQSIGLDEYKKKGAVEAATGGYLTHTTQKFRVRDCIHNLRLKQNTTNTSFDVPLNEYTVRYIKQYSGTVKLFILFSFTWALLSLWGVVYTPRDLASRTSVSRPTTRDILSLAPSSAPSSLPLIPTPSELARHEAFWVVPFERNDHFTGRKSQLAQLEGKLFARDRTAKIAITGLGGVGKTQLVLELVYRIRDKYENCSVIWITAINMESLQQAYLDVAQKLGIPGWDEDTVDVKRLVHEYLSKESAGQWLLVFDNADDIGMWTDRPSRLTEYLPRSKQGCIVFTTRDKKTAVKLAHQNVVEVLEMNENEATQLLQKYLANPDLLNNEQDTKVLLEQLTYLPLAIVQAAAYINGNSIALTDYLSLLEDQEENVIDLLSEEFEDDGRYCDVKNPVATTWLISFEQIRQRDPLAAEFLSFIACVDSKDVPQSLLPPGPSQKKETDAIGTLVAYSFISRQADLTLDIHRLVHLATRNWLRKEELLAHWTERAITRLDVVFPDNDHQNRSIWRRYLTHARYALESNVINKCGKEGSQLAWKLGMCLCSDGRFNEAEAVITEVMETRKKILGKEHPDTLWSMNSLAFLLANHGKYNEAEPIYRQTLLLLEKVLGKEHPDTLRSMNNLAYMLMSQGKYDEAEPIYQQTLLLLEKVLGKEHRYTLATMNNLANLLENQGYS